MSKDNSKKETKEEETQEKLFQYDRYGFLLEKELPQDRTKDELKSVKNEVNNADKWNEMMNNWEKFATKKKNILKKRIRKGIPGPFRGKAWFKITESDSLREKMKKKGGEDFYQKLLEKQNEKANMVIERDIDRTFPKHEHYREGSEQKRLSRVLRAWSVYNETVGYCQGMAFVAALLLFFMEEEDAFWTFVVLMEKFHMNRLYLDGFPLVVQELYQWDRMLEKLDKKLFLHLKKQGVISSMYASKWFLTIFASTFSFSIVIRIWDNYIYDGIIFVFQTAFAILKLFRKSLLKMDFEKLLGFLQNIQLQEIKEEELISTALSVNISHKDLAIWADEHAKQLQKQEKEKEKEKEEKQEKEKN